MLNKNVLGDSIGSIELVKNANNDLSVVNSARVSFNKHSNSFTSKVDLPKGSDEGLVNFLAKHNHWTPFSHIICVKHRKMTPTEFIMWFSETQDMQFYRVFKTVNDSTVEFFERGSLYSYITAGEIPSNKLDIKYAINAFIHDRTLSYCAYGTILKDISDLAFDMSGMLNYISDTGCLIDNDELENLVSKTFRIKMPIFVARQWFKHMIGFTRNEVSRRYVNSDPEFFIPDEFRLSAENVKQGSSSEFITEFEDEHGVLNLMDLVTSNSLSSTGDYLLLNQGANICAEQSRIVLPQNMYTEFYETGTIAAYRRLFGLRCEKTSQLETQKYAMSIRDTLLNENNT